MTAGRVGPPHGLDGSFRVERPDHPLEQGTIVHVGGEPRRVTRRRGAAERPIIRLEGVDTRQAAAALRHELLLVEARLAEGEWLACDLAGCEVPGHGRVRRVLAGSSCSLLELEGGELLPLVSDAIRCIDVERRQIEVDAAFLG